MRRRHLWRRMMAVKADDGTMPKTSRKHFGFLWGKKDKYYVKCYFIYFFKSHYLKVFS